jgi:hypothetical protein
METYKVPQRIYQKKRIHSALFVIECPECGVWLASGSELNILPSYSTCNCASLNADQLKKTNHGKI